MALYGIINKQVPERESNIELFRIVCMLSIIAHHYVVHTGLVGEPMLSDPRNPSSLFLSIFGMWGKTGINCFLMITGYFMCQKEISIKKWLKFYFQILFYNVVISIFLILIGGGIFSILDIVSMAIPFVDISRHFVSCYLLFYLLIPFINILIKNMTRYEHARLIILLIIIYSFIGSMPLFNVQFSYVTWFSLVYLIAAYLRLHPNKYTGEHVFWGKMLFCSCILSIASVLIIQSVIGRGEWIFVSDSNAIFALIVSISSFMWFKDIKIPYNKYINTISSTVFGVLLIHDNSPAMRSWLWETVVGGKGLFEQPTVKLILFSTVIVCIVFCISSIIELIRKSFLEDPIWRYIDSKKWKLQF